MLHTLRNRLLLSYVVILLVLLLLVGFILLVFLAARPLPTGDLMADLTAALLDVRIGEAIRVEIAFPEPGMMRPQVSTLEERLVTFLSDEAGRRDIRALVVSGAGVVRFDSEGAFAEGDTIQETTRVPLVPSSRMRVYALYRGEFANPDGSTWLYVAQPLRPLAMMGSDALYLMVAAPEPRTSLREVFRTFGRTFFVPLAQAGLVGLVIAVGLSALIAGSVARPLKQMSLAARRIARGDYRQRVPVKGPRETRALAEAFNEMAARTAASQQAQRDFLANVSHDLRTPLTSIQGFSQAIAEGVTSDPDSARRAAQIICDEAGRLHRMVESLMDLARIEAGQADLRRQSVALGDLLRGVGESVSVRARDRRLQLELDIAPDLPPIAGDGDRLAQVFTNLLDNAIRHTPAGGRITLRAEAAQGGVVVQVSDTGEGIPSADLPRIFERFYQVDKSRQRERQSGMGLGLAIVKQIVEAHGGAIHVASAIGQGTTFTVWLPLAGAGPHRSL